MSFGDKLKKLRLKSKMTQGDVCQKLSLEQSTLANYENSRRFPKPKTLVALAELFNVSTDYLLGRKESTQISSHHLNADTLQLINEFENNPQMQMLFDAARGLSKEKMNEVLRFIEFQHTKQSSSKSY